MSTVINAEMPAPNEQKTLHVRPKDTIEFNDLVLENVFIDILGPDIMLTDSTTNTRIVFPGLGLILFSEEDAPSMRANGEILTPKELLSKVGRVHNITQDDYVSFTSLDLNPNKGTDDADESESENQSVGEEVIILDYAAFQQQAPQRNTKDPDEDERNREEIETLIESRSNLNEDTDGVPLIATLVESSDKSAPQQKAAEPEAEPEAPDARTRFDFDTRMLQLASIEPAAGADVFGGGGSELSAFDPSNSAQFNSQETIDLSGDDSGLTISADNPDFFSATTATRVIQYSPNLPDFFDVSEVKLTISGTTGALTPSDFSVFMLDDDGTSYNEVAATFDILTGEFVFDMADIVVDSRGDINVAIVYDTTFANETFDIQLEATAEFDVLSGEPIPEEPLQTRTIDRTVKITPDFSAEDGSFDWYLEDVPNNTRVFTGDGDDVINGGQGIDIIETNGGDDIIVGDFGDNGSNDQIDAGEGGETVGDTVIYSARSEDITVDLGAGGAVADGSGFFDATIGIAGEVDKLQNIENITGGAGNDTIFGDDDAFGNILDGGAGDDNIMGGLGNDTLTGGLGIDTLNYSYITGAGAGITIDLSSGAVTAGGGDVDTITDQFEHLIATDRNDTLIGNTLDNDIDGGAGIDTIDYSGRAGTGGLTVDFSTLIGGMSILTFGSIPEQDRLMNVEYLIGTDQNDNVTGDANDNVYDLRDGDDVVDGGDGDDTIDAGDGDDNVDGGAGDDVISGGAGVDVIDGGTNTAVGDTVDYSAESGVLNVNLATTVVSQDGAGDSDTLINIENVIGGSGANTLRGSASDNVFTGGANTDDFFGSGGNDNFIGNGGTNTLDYTELASGNINVNWNGAGNTIIKGAGGTDTFSGIDVIEGSVLNTDVLTLAVAGLTVQASGAYFSPDGLTTLIRVENVEGSSGIDNVSGTTLDNIINGNDGNDILGGGAGDDTVSGGDGDDTIDGDGDNDTLFGDDGDDTIDGGSGDDNIDGGTGDDVISGGAGVDVIDGGTNTAVGDTVDYSAESGALDINLDTGVVAQDGSGSSDTVSNIENIIGGSGTNTMRGNADNNVMTGGANTDNFFGSAGNDTYDGNGGTNTLDYTELASGNINVNWDGANNTVVKGAGGTDDFSNIDVLEGSVLNTDILTLTVAGLTVQSSGAYFSPDGLATLIRVENVEGSSGTDTIFAMNTGTIDNIINGNGGNDTIYGGDGNHTLNGGGGTGDVLRFSTLSDITFDFITSTANFSTYTNTFSGFEEFYLSSGNDVITGSAGDDGLVRGEGGNDTFFVSDGSDDFNGGAGTDTYNFSAATGAINVNLAAGSNQVIDDGFGNTETVTNVENIIGTTFDDTITGNNLDNDITGGDGIDTISGGSGDDVITGGDGDDILAGGNDDDTISGGNNDDVIRGEAGNDTLTGDAGDDIISGGAGVDNIDGGANTAVGDTVDYSAESGTVNINLDTGVVSQDGTGSSDTLTDIENAIGGTGNNTFRGTAGDNVFSANGTADTFYGSGGNDTFNSTAATTVIYYTELAAGDINVQWDNVNNDIDKGAGGTDSYSSTGTTVIVGSTEATDTLTLLVGGLTVQNTFGFFSPDALNTFIGVENVEGSAGTDIIFSATTGTNDNVINGNGGDDTIYGGNGNHTLDGGTTGETTGDILRLSTSSTVTFDLTTGTASFGGFTNTFSNFEEYFIGDGNSTINGTAGNDGVVNGENGSDTFFVSDGIDGFNGGGGTDTYDFAASTSAINVNMTLGANQVIDDGFGNTETITSVERIFGSNFDDTITGSAAANNLQGRDGIDTINGAGGGDTISGGNGDDILSGGDGNDNIDGGNNNDTINGGNDDDTLNGGAGNDIINGDAGDDIIIGGTGDDTIDGGTNNPVTASADGDVADYRAEGSAIVVNLSTVGVNATGATIGNDTLTNIENVFGGDGNDSITGDANSNRLRGYDGDDTINGGAGDDFLYGHDDDDTLIGGAGDDLLDGGNQFDTIDYSSAAGAVTVNLNTNTTTDDGFGDQDTLVDIEAVILTGNDDTIVGGAGNFTLTGGNGNDTLDYSNNTDGINANLSAFGTTITGTVNKTNGGAVTTDSVVSFESLVGGTGNDTFTFNTDAMIDASPLLGTVDGGTGYNRLRINDSLTGNNLTDNGIDGNTIAGIFSNIDELDLTGATVDGGFDTSDYTLNDDADDFDLTQADVQALVGVGGTLNLTIDSTFDLFISGATNQGGGTFDWGDGTTVQVTTA